MAVKSYIKIFSFTHPSKFVKIFQKGSLHVHHFTKLLKYQSNRHIPIQKPILGARKSGFFYQ